MIRGGILLSPEQTAEFSSASQKERDLIIQIITEKLQRNEPRPPPKRMAKKCRRVGKATRWLVDGEWRTARQLAEYWGQNQDTARYRAWRERYSVRLPGTPAAVDHPVAAAIDPPR